MFAVPSSASRKKAETWLDSSTVTVVPAAYVPDQDAYIVSGVSDGYAPVSTTTADNWNQEYEDLKTTLLKETLLVGTFGVTLVTLLLGKDLGCIFALGVAGGVLYLTLLQKGVDQLGKGGLLENLSNLRFGVLVPLFALLTLDGSVSRQEVLSLVGGFLCYKVPFLARTGGEVVEGLAGVQVGQGGVLGSVLGMAARSIKEKSKETEKEDSDVTGAPVVVFAGPSGVGKSTLIAKMMEDFDGKFCYSVSHTTREKRDGEVDGVDYYFISQDKFEQMVKEDRFLEYARVHARSYGTSYETVDEVLGRGQVCVLDCDVQGVETLRKKGGLGWDARFIWIAPPSIEALKERLKDRGSETNDTLKRRLDTAMREIAFAATNNVFDVTIINDDLDKAYAELKRYIENNVFPRDS